MHRWDWVLAGVMGSVHFAFHFFMRIVPSLIPVLAVDLGLPLWQLGALVSMFFAGASLGLLPAGVLSDSVDRRVTLTAGMLVVSLGFVGFALAPLIGPLSPQMTVAGHTVGGTTVLLNAAMFVAGLGTSVHIPVGIPLVTTNASAERVGTLLGVWGGFSKVGDAAAPACVGVLILAFAWQDIVLAFAVLGLCYTVVLYVLLGSESFETVPETVSNDRQVTDAAPIWAADRRVYLYPMAALVLYFAAYQAVVQGVVTFTPTFVTDVYGYEFSALGVHFGPESFADFALSMLLVAGALSRFGAGLVVDRYDHKSVLVWTLTVAAGTLFLVSVVSLGPLALLATMAVFGATLWGNSPARDTLISDLSPAGREGRTFSYLWTASRLFAALSPTVVGWVADATGVRRAFEGLSVLVALAAVAILLLYSDRVYVEGG